MVNEYRSPGAEEGSGTHLEARRSWRAKPWWASRLVALVVLGLQTACAAGYPMGGMLAGSARHRWRVQRGKCVEYDGFDPTEGVLLEGKARGYAHWFDKDLEPTLEFYGGLDDMLKQAARQSQMAAGRPIRWHVAEPRMVAVLRKHFDEANLGSIEVVYTPPVK